MNAISTTWAVVCVAGGDLHVLEIREMMEVNRRKFLAGEGGTGYEPVTGADSLDQAIDRMKILKHKRKEKKAEEED